MGVIVSFYSKTAFKEFILPSEKNADYDITLRANYFGIVDDIKIQFEVLSGVWSIKKTKQYFIETERGTIDSESKVLDNQAEFIIHVPMYESGDVDIYMFVRYTEMSLHAYTKYSLDGIDSLMIGKNSQNDICYDFRRLVSREHAVIKRVDDRYIIKNMGVNGVYVNSSMVVDEIKLEFGDYINILGLHIVYLGNIIAIDKTYTDMVLNEKVLKHVSIKDETVTYEEKKGEKLTQGLLTYHRAPRNYEKLENDIIDIELPPPLEKYKKRSILMSIGPSMSMSLPMLLGCLLMLYSNSSSGGRSSLYMYSGLMMSVSSAVIGVFWTLFNQRQEKKVKKEQEKHRFETYSDYLLEKENEIKLNYDDTIRRLEETYPDLETCLEYDEKKGFLWNRNYSHDDFLAVRLGIGEREFQCRIDVPQKKFNLYKDELSEQPQRIKKKYEKLINVPVTVDLLQKHLVGIVGGNNKVGAIVVAKILAAQIAANNCYVDVKMAFIFDNESSDDNESWDYVKWFPHVWSQDKRVRYIASNKNDASEVFYELTKVFREREENFQNTYGSVSRRPHYVVFVSNRDMLEGEGFEKYALSQSEKLGLTTIILTDRRENLPNECEFLIENSEDFSGEYSVYENASLRQQIKFDNVDSMKLDKFARHLSALHVAETERGGEVPESITFFDMLGINSIYEYPVKEMWAKSKTYENIRGMLGYRAGGVPCYLDVHEKFHGPHGLIAGTTGSGKSETLQTYILSLAINYSPDDVAFFIIDYKGGGMANLFEGLPHMIGSISNLSGNQVKRAMISIKSENRRRQRIFAEHGVNNINLYTKLYKNGEALIPVPHLFIIIDEFAELKREEPEFMKELISVAQVGRSLGVHLILATQKPSGTVDDNIWSNSKFRICLRVQDQQDSKDMLHKPDAAYITQAGRGYLQVGNDEVYELFQSGFSGAVFDENAAISVGDIAKLVNMQGKVDMTGNSVRMSQKKHADIIWLDKMCKVLVHAIRSGLNRIKESVDAEGKVDFIVANMYDNFYAQGIDYEDNAFNRARLREFIQLYMFISKSGSEKNISIAEQIIMLANKYGKKIPQPKEKTQLDVTKEYLSQLAHDNGYIHKISLWMPLLRKKIYLSEFEEHTDICYRNGKWSEPTDEWNLQIIIGQVDDPENQSQMPLMLDFAKQGNVAVIGSVVSGKSTLMQTIIYGLITHFTPEYVNIYALDFSSRMLSAFEKAPHVGGVIYEGDDKKIARFFNMLQKIVKKRKVLFKGGNYKQYLKRNGVIVPAIVIFVDDYASFKAKTEMAYEEQMLHLSKEGVSLGIYLVISGSGFRYDDINSKLGENLATAYCLALSEKYEYREMLHNMQIDVLPEVGIKGRGLVSYDSRILEYQVALAQVAENDYQRIESISALCENMLKNWNGNRAVKIPEIPENPTWSMFTSLVQYKQQIKNKDYLAVAYDEADAEIYSIPLRDIYCYLITGLSFSGKTNFMRIMLQAALDKEAHVAVLDSPMEEFKQYAEDGRIYYSMGEKEIYIYFRDQLTPVFQKRNKIKNDMLTMHNDEIDIYEKMSREQPFFVFIPDMSWFVKMVYSSSENMAGFMETLVAKGRYHNIYFIGEIGINKISEVRGYRMFETFCEYHTGVHFGGKSNNNMIMSFEYMSFVQQSEIETVGVGRIPGTATYTGTKKIVVPFARK